MDFYDPTGRKGYFGYGGADDALIITNDLNAPLVFLTNATEKMRLDASGNLGLGVTPSAWGTSGTVLKALQLGTGSSGGNFIAGANGFAGTFLGTNSYFNGTNWIYSTTAAAAYYNVTAGSHVWYNAPSGTAGNAITFTQAMTLDASGNLGLGTASPTFAFEIDKAQATGNMLRIKRSGIAGEFQIYQGTNTIYLDSAAASGNLAFSTVGTERMRLDSSGNLLVATTTAYAKTVSISSDGVLAGVIGINDFSGVGCVDSWNRATSGNNTFSVFGTEVSFTTRGSITYNRTGGLVVYNTTSDYRAKDIIGPVQDSGATIDALKVYEGQMKGATQSRPMLIAHEAQAVTPYAVTGEKDAVKKDGTPDYQQMDVSSLVPLLVAEIQSLRIRISQLEAK
jgi:hypothetical protein